MHTEVCNRLAFILWKDLLEVQFGSCLPLFLQSSIKLILLSLVHFGPSVLFSVLVVLFPFFPHSVLYSNYIFSFSITFLQVSFSLFLLLWALLSNVGVFLVLLSDLQIFLLSISQIHQIHVLSTHPGTVSKVLTLWIHEKCAVSWRKEGGLRDVNLIWHYLISISKQVNILN